jgi:hypothetical protein
MHVMTDIIKIIRKMFVFRISANYYFLALYYKKFNPNIPVVVRYMAAILNRWQHNAALCSSRHSIGSGIMIHPRNLN